MRPGPNAVEASKASKGGDGLRIREDLPGLIEKGYESMTPAEKDLLKWVGVFFRKPTPGRFMMRIRMPNGFTNSRQLRAVADLSLRLGNCVLDITTRQQIQLRGFTLANVPNIWEKLRGVDLHSLQTGMMVYAVAIYVGGRTGPDAKPGNGSGRLRFHIAGPSGGMIRKIGPLAEPDQTFPWQVSGMPEFSPPQEAAEEQISEAPGLASAE